MSEFAATQKRLLTVCADDFGPSPATARVILSLAQAGRLNAVSCITNLPGWAAQAALLRDAPHTLQCGLHFNLTEGVPLSHALARHWRRMPALPVLMAAAGLRCLPLAALADELTAQLDAFHHATGQLPTHVDGHQHVHHLPGIRSLLLRALGSLPQPVAVRNTARMPGPGYGVKRQLIMHSGGVALRAALRLHRIDHNFCLLGAYDFKAADYRRLMQGWLRRLPAQGGLLFCHPGGLDDDGGLTAGTDPIATARVREAAYFGSAAFTEDLAQAGVRLAPAWRVDDGTFSGKSSAG